MKTRTKREATRTTASAGRAEAVSAAGTGPLGALQRLADGSAATRRLGAMQRMSLEEEPIQGKAVQRAEEEEMLQGKAIQRAVDEEEPETMPAVGPASQEEEASPG